MYKIVVADDEEELRRAVIRKIDWASIGFTVVGEAENGIEALELVEKMEPDLLLSDIRMPFITGIELAKQVREIRPSTQIAFLSGYDDFAYAQQAIKYNIISYLLKPITMSDLTRELLVIKERLDCLFEEFDSKQKTRVDQSGFVMPLLLDPFQIEMKTEQETMLRRQAIECGLLKEEDAYAYAVITTSIRDEDGNSYTTREHVHSIDMILKKYLHCVSFYTDGRIVSLLLATQADFDWCLHILVEEIIQSIRRIMNSHCAIGVSRIVSELSGCHDAYREAMNAMSYSNRNDSSAHYIADEERNSDFDTKRVLNAVSEVESLVRSGGTEELERYLKDIFLEMQKNTATRTKINFLLVQLLSSVCRILYTVADGEDLPELESLPLMQKMSFYGESWKETEEHFIRFCLAVRNQISIQKKKSSEVLCERTLHMIETDYQTMNLSLVSVSSAVGVSSTYLSALIKKETGKTFVDLLTKKRLETARNLLLCTSMKVKEIAERCGYSEQNYFSYCFKKYMGISPNALRRQMEHEEESGT